MDDERALAHFGVILLFDEVDGFDLEHVRGPSEPITFAGRRIRSTIPMGVGADGNMTVYFEVFAYAGMVTITAIADPVRFPDLDVLTHAVRAELGRIAEETGHRPQR